VEEELTHYTGAHYARHGHVPQRCQERTYQRRLEHHARPYTLTCGQRNVFVDLDAERLIAAEKDREKIAVEIKRFQGVSDGRDLEMAIGQYVFYRSLLTRH
jgi:hypothetical protein